MDGVVDGVVDAVVDAVVNVAVNGHARPFRAGVKVSPAPAY